MVEAVNRVKPPKPPASGQSRYDADGVTASLYGSSSGALRRWLRAGAERIVDAVVLRHVEHFNYRQYEAEKQQQVTYEAGVATLPWTSYPDDIAGGTQHVLKGYDPPGFQQWHIRVFTPKERPTRHHPHLEDAHAEELFALFPENGYPKLTDAKKALLAEFLRLRQRRGDHDRPETA